MMATVGCSVVAVSEYKGGMILLLLFIVVFMSMIDIDCGCRNFILVLVVGVVVELIVVGMMVVGDEHVLTTENEGVPVLTTDSAIFPETQAGCVSSL